MKIELHPIMNMEVIRFEHNGMDCFYYADELNNVQGMKAIAEELEQFQKQFFNQQEAGVSWSDVMEDDDIYKQWNYFHIQNDWVNLVESKADKANLMQDETFTFEKAYNEAHEELKTKKAWLEVRYNHYIKPSNILTEMKCIICKEEFQGVKGYNHACTKCTPLYNDLMKHFKKEAE